jgi:CRP-like cAMP-binding protein
MTLDLSTHAFTDGLTEAQLAALSAFASEAVFKENEVVLLKGERSTGFYLLMSGSVAVELRTPRCAVCVQALGPGQAFGWSALLEDQDTLFQVRSRELTTALRLDGAALKALCRADTALGVEILHRALTEVAGRVKATELRFAEMCGLRA